jgi:hypothetical protein
MTKTWNGKVTDSGQGYKPTYSFEFVNVESPAWSAGRASYDTVPEWAVNVAVSVNGNAYRITSGGTWSAMRISYSGYVRILRGSPVIALADKGGWSGGRNYAGYIFGKPGDIVEFNKKGYMKYLVFSENEKPEETTINPTAEYAEL